MNDEARDWLQYAESDLEAAGVMLERGLHRHCLFECRYATEAALKAVAVGLGMKPPHIHDLQELADAARLPLTDAQRLYLLRLNDHATATSYLSAGDDAVRQLHAETEEFFRWLRHRLS